MVGDYGVADLNPKSQAVKSLETTVVRAIQLIDAFDALEPGCDWTDVPGSTYRKVIGERYEYATLLSECWVRYQKGTLHQQVLDLAANLPPSALERKEIADGLSRINSRQDTRQQKRPASSAPRARRPRQSRLF